MEKHGKFVFLLLICLAVAVGAFFLFSGGGATPIDVVPASTSTDPASLSVTPALTATIDGDHAAPVRSTVNVPGARPAQDPEIVAALAKFKGRVVAHDGTPAPERTVRLLRIDAQVAFQLEISMFSAPITDFPDVFAGETITGADGRFELTGVWPRSIYILKADALGPNPTLRLADRTPGPSETVDLGDIALKNAATVTGVVIDDGGKPVVGAMVRAADIPAIATQFLPLEQFDPEGWFIVGDADKRMVVELPAWANKFWKELPVPTTLSDAEGHFRLEGIEPGVNLIAATKSGFVAATQKNVKLDAGQTRDIGKLELGEGEVASGRVVDQQGKPIAGVHVIVGNRLNAVPIAFGRDAGKTDNKGTFECRGLGSSNVIAAAQRAPGEPWVITEPQSIQTDIVVTLPSRHTLTVHLLSELGQAIVSPRLRLLSFGDATGEDELPVFAQLGIARPVPLEARQTKLPDGRLQLRELSAGKYAIVAGAAGHAATMQTVDLTGDRDVELRLPPEQMIDVVVVDAQDKPIRNAAVYVELRGKGPDMIPLHAGHTGSDGKVRAKEMHGESAVVEATHPRFGAVAAKVDLPATTPVVLKMCDPATIVGEVTEDGKPPELGKYTAVVQRAGSETHGPVSGMPAIAMLDADGKFTMRGLQPGPWRVEVIKSLQAMRSFSSMMELMMMAQFSNQLPEQDVQLVAGQTTQVRLETNAPRIVEGPSARVGGTVWVDGRPGEGMIVHSWSEQQVSAVVDASGRFDLGQVKEGSIHLRVAEAPRGGLANLTSFNDAVWSQQVEVKVGNDVNLRIEVTTGSLVGFVLDVDGKPAGAVQVSAWGNVKGPDKNLARSGGSTLTDEEGRFELKRLPACTYHIECDGGTRGRAHATATVATGSQASVRAQLLRTFTLRGKIDRKTLAQDKEDRWLWLSLERQGGGLGEAGGQGGMVDREGDTFSIDGVLPGAYTLRIHGNMEGEWTHDGAIDITRDVDHFVVRPIKLPTPVPKSEAKKGN